MTTSNEGEDSGDDNRATMDSPSTSNPNINMDTSRTARTSSTSSMNTTRSSSSRTAMKAEPQTQPQHENKTETETDPERKVSYKILAMVQRGLQQDVTDQIIKASEDMNTNTSTSTSTNTDTNMDTRRAISLSSSIDASKNAVQIEILDEDADGRQIHGHSYGNEARRRFLERQTKKNQSLNPWCRRPVGTVGIDLANGLGSGPGLGVTTNATVHISIGYSNTNINTNTNKTRPSRRIDDNDKQGDNDDDNGDPDHDLRWTGPGQTFGTTWLQVTSDNLTTLNSVASLRCIGPLLSLVRVGSLNNNEQETDTLEQVTKRFSAWIAGDTTNSKSRRSYGQDLETALELWKRHVQTSWKEQLSAQDYDGLQQRIQTDQLRFRVSCIREMTPATTSSNTKKSRRKHQKKEDPQTDDSAHAGRAPPSSYTRQEFVTSVMHACSDSLVPKYGPQDGWQVDLDHYDLELVLIVTATMTVGIGISMCPYSFRGSKSFASGNFPPDITPPYLGGDVLSAGIVRLRPTTAHSLLHVAELNPSDVVLDPCAGIGTIPIEADKYGTPSASSSTAIGLGGDVVLHHPQLLAAAAALEETAAAGTAPIMTISDDEHDGGAGSSSKRASSLLAAWDATHLPLRTACVDVVVSDLPFGQQCLSASALHQLLPLILWQCARVLTPNTGRMVLLCGLPNAIWKALDESSKEYWVQPCTRTTPVTIGGIVAWIIRVERNGKPFDQDSMTRFLHRIRKVAQRRDRIAQLQKYDEEKQGTKNHQKLKRRRIVQS